MRGVPAGAEDGDQAAGLDDAAAEAESLLADLTSSQAEVNRMLKQQAEQAAELGSLKDKLTSEVCISAKWLLLCLPSWLPVCSLC
jgi:Tfp pilus assembly protein PilO